jgi:hypothetical protein
MKLRRPGAWLVGAALAAVVSLVAIQATPAAVAYSVITPTDMQGWGFATEGGAGGTGALVLGPGAPPAGSGSAQLGVTGSDQGVILGAAVMQGLRLSDLAQLQYSTYRQAGDPATAISLQLNVDYDLDDGNESWQGRLVYEPYQNGAPASGTWQTWETVNGTWWATGAPGGACPQSSPCTMSQLRTAFPNIGIHRTLGGILFKAGSGWTNFVGNVDYLVIGTVPPPQDPDGVIVGGSQLIFDFESGDRDDDGDGIPDTAPPADKDQCKKDGWRSFNNPSFRNQGDCVSSVATQPKAPKPPKS